MAAINSHRKRQVYSDWVHRKSYGSNHGNAPTGASTMMPDKNMDSQTWGVTRRNFADVTLMLSRKYLGTTLRTETKKDPYTGAYATRDVLQTSPSGVVNPHNAHNPMRYYYSNSPSGAPLIYATEVSGVTSLFNYSRAKTGLINNSYTTYKKVGSNYQHVMSLGDQQGGNIKSRATVLKWTAGMWREKK